MADNAQWYVIQTYSGYENTVKATIDKTIENRQLQDVIVEARIPMETVTELTDNGPKTYERKLFPGYVLVKMVMNPETWYIVRNVRGVTGFVGASSTNPIPLTEEEAIKWGVEHHEVVVSFNVGDEVRIVDGFLASVKGRVESLDVDNNSVRVIVSMFGRETPIDLEIDQVESISDSE